MGVLASILPDAWRVPLNISGVEGRLIERWSKKEHQFVIVMISGGKVHPQADGDFSHLGFAMESRAAVDAVAARAKDAGLLAWPPRDEAYPVGYYCGIRAPDGNVVEFSYDQPLGPGAGQSMLAHADA